MTAVVVTVLSVPAADGELGADRLTSAGAFAIEERPAEPDGIELRATLGDSEAVVRERLGELPTTWSLQLERIDSASLDTWRQFAAPVRVADDLVVRPAWSEPIGEERVTEVVIEPGVTFGLGDHPTTRLTAGAVWRLAGARAGQTVLDVGCGSGVLAIVALVAGADRATAIDISSAAPAVVLDNARRNRVAGRIVASTTPLHQVSGSFDLVVANILAPSLIALAGDLRRVTSPGGALIVSGVLADRHDHVLAALAPMQVTTTERLDGWAAVELRHPARPAQV